MIVRNVCHVVMCRFNILFIPTSQLFIVKAEFNVEIEIMDRKKEYCIIFISINSHSE